jgi:hypothetical protein
MIVICPGHNLQSQGASYKGITEHQEACLWSTEVVKLLRDYFPVPTFFGDLPGKVKAINNLEGVKLCCEIHFNSDTSKRSAGSETLYMPGSVLGKKAADAVQAELATVFPPSRGAKEGWYRQDHPNKYEFQGDVEGDEVPLYFLEKTKFTALIVEPEFIYNYDTLSKKRHDGCVSLAQGLLKALQAIEVQHGNP